MMMMMQDDAKRYRRFGSVRFGDGDYKMNMAVEKIEHCPATSVESVLFSLSPC